MNTDDLRTLDGLRAGTPRQQQARGVLLDNGVWAALAAYDPVLCGTIPLDVDVETSDLDVICEAHDLDVFLSDVTAAFGGRPAFEAYQTIIDGRPSAIARFRLDSFEVEIFGQNCPVTRQNAFVHLQIEARLLALADEGAKEDIRRLKQAGMKTEPAFAEYFELPGDPYQTLLVLQALDDEPILRQIAGRRTSSLLPVQEAGNNKQTIT